MAIVTEEESIKIKELYQKFRSEGFSKQAARRKVSEKTKRGMTTIFDHTWMVDDPPPDFTKKDFKAEWPKTYIITGWELRVGINDKFVETLEQMAKAYDAELILVPCQASDVNYVPDKLKEKFHIVVNDIKFNDNLLFKYVETNALIQSPLAGHAGAYPDTTTIIPGLVKELRTEASQQYVKQLISTGSIGYLNAKYAQYGDLNEDKDFVKKWKTVGTRRHGKATAIAQNYVVPSALIVDVLDKKTFLTRFITSYKGGVVYDLDKKFTPSGVEKSQPLALVTGDFHANEVDEDSLKATKDMIRFFNPQEVVLNDFFNGESVNHHEVGDAITFSKAPSIEEEADITVKLLKDLARISNKITYMQSNHDNFLLKFLSKSENLWKLNRNYTVACGLQLYRAENNRHPIEKLLDFDNIKNLQFIDERDNYYIGKVLIKHGHEGVSGVRAGFLTLAKMYNNYAQGHSHVPMVFRNAICVGTNSILKPSYVVGANGWMSANGLIHPDSSQQLLSIVYGQWIR